MATISRAVSQQLAELQKTSPKRAKWLQKAFRVIAPKVSQDNFDIMAEAVLSEQAPPEVKSIFERFLDSFLKTEKLGRQIRRLSWPEPTEPFRSPTHTSADRLPREPENVVPAAPRKSAGGPGLRELLEVFLDEKSPPKLRAICKKFLKLLLETEKLKEDMRAMFGPPETHENGTELFLTSADQQADQQET